jgi:hypothetical protein
VNFVDHIIPDREQFKVLYKYSHEEIQYDELAKDQEGHEKNGGYNRFYSSVVIVEDLCPTIISQNYEYCKECI